MSKETFQGFLKTKFVHVYIIKNTKLTAIMEGYLQHWYYMELTVSLHLFQTVR